MELSHKLARIAVSKIIECYGEKCPCCYCITRPICNKLCDDINDYLSDLRVAYLCKNEFIETMYKGGLKLRK